MQGPGDPDKSEKITCVKLHTHRKEWRTCIGLPKEIAALIERFDRNREIYASGQYHEMQLRQEFINPLFAIYDTPIKPEKTDKASNARIRYFTYKDYAEKCDELKRLYKKRKEAGRMK